MINKKSKNPFERGLFNVLVSINPIGKAAIILVLIFGSGLFVYTTGGTWYVYSHIMYIPIILAAYLFNVPGGIITGIVAGIVLGPFMPLNVETGELQSTVNWLFRTVIFSIAGLILGSMFSLAKKRLEEIQRLALFDRDTGLPNRAHLLLTIEKLAKEANTDTQYALFILLLDNHSQITRILDAEELSKLNKQLSQRSNSVLKSYENIYLLFPYLLCIIVRADGGEEYCKVLADTIYSQFQSPIKVNKIPVYINISIGVAIDYIRDINPSLFLQQGMIAANIASEKELNYWIYRQEEFDAVKNKQILLGGVTTAIRDNEFELHYQPIIRMSTGHIIGVEALLRWHHPKLGNIPPMEFLPTLENTSLLYSVHDWVMEKAMSELMDWEFFSGSMAINLSTRLLLDHGWIKKYEDLLKRLKLDPVRIVFEITETAIMKDIEKSAVALSRLKAMGSSISLDDFGTGYSSLEYIQMLPIDYMKIDQRFISSIVNSTKSQMIAKAAISLARSIGVETVAEGIETQAEYDWLVKEGCIYGQGFMISKPMPGKALVKWVQEEHGIGKESKVHNSLDLNQ
ncbi:MAG TPA: hypothetical protein DCK95_00360 [Anaerolineaceae bacterium]|nr:hypothetical protein [Anaerolineaceae bacterium]